MDDFLLPILALAFLVVGALYSSVGHAGASGYLAIMALVGIEATVMRPTALAINILVASMASVQFMCAGHFSLKQFWPFAILSIPAAFLGATMPIGARPLQLAIGAVLLLTAIWMARTAIQPIASTAPKPPPTSVAVGAGGLIGFIAGITGTGGGIFLSPISLYFNWADTKRTAALAAMFILANSIAGLSGLAVDGWKPDSSLVVLAGAAGVGGLIGSHLGSRRFGNRSLRSVLAVVLLVAGTKLLVTGLAT